MNVLFFLQLKRAVKAVPRLLAGAILPLLLAGVVLFITAKQHTKESETLLSPVALVNHDSEAYLDFILPMIAEADAAGSYSFVPMEEQEAMNALNKGTVCAVLLFPPDMFSGILDSTNTPALLYLPEGDSFPSLLLGKFAEAGALTLGSAQAGIYAASELYREYGLSAHLSDIYYEINMKNLKYALDRESVFSSRSTTPTGEMTLPEYYGCTLFVCLLLFIGAGMGSFLCNTATKTFCDQLRRRGIGTFAYEASLFLPLFLFYLLITAGLSATAMVLLPEITFSLTAVFYLLCVALCFSAYTKLIFSLLQNAGRGLLAYTFLGLFMLFIGGGFLPYAFLPTLFSKLTPFLPLSACLSGMRTLFGDAVAPASCLILLAHTGVMLLLLFVLSMLRRREVIL